MKNYIGEIAALLTSICWSFTSIFFTIAGKKVGSITVNRIRLLLASSYLMILHFFIYGNVLPIHTESYRWWWLGLSGIIGLIIGDGMLLQAFVLIGPRLSMLLMSLVPIVSTIFAWIFLHEILGTVEVIAILLTVGGIIWVVLERKNEKDRLQIKHYLSGIVLGMGGALGQALALITAKKGLIGDFPALSANLIRIITSTGIIWLMAIYQGKAISDFNFWKNSTARWSIFGGSIFGPFLGIWFSMIAIKYTHVGIASTLMALPPIFLIPLTYWLFKEQSSWHSIIGTMIATVGVALIFLH